jgi:hypothetical protein
MVDPEPKPSVLFFPCGAGKIEFEQKGEWIDIDGNAIGGANGGVE